MENQSPTPAPAPSLNPQAATSDNTWAIILISAIGIWLLFRKAPKKSKANDSEKIDTYSKLRTTPLGKSIDEQIQGEGIELSSAQILKLDSCLEDLSEEDYKLLSKASRFVKKEDLYAALSEKEMKQFKPLRKKIVECLDEALNS